MMMVTSTGYTEDYARVMLRDVKGFFVTPTDRRMWFRVGWGICALLFLAGTAVGVASNTEPYFRGFFLFFCTVVVIWNEALGPTCRVSVVTGVQTARIPSLARRKKAVRVLAQLRPLIEAAQADLVPPLPPLPPVPNLPSQVTEAPVAAPLPAPPT